MSRDPFVRPFLAWFFYGLSVLSAVATAPVVLAARSDLRALGLPTDAGYGVNLVVLTILFWVVQTMALAAVGYVIEKIAKIEWNTRPPDDEAFGFSTPRNGPVDRRYFFIANGPIQGPFTGSALLELHRDGKIPGNARLFVEENGQRRPVPTWAEVALNP